jgi:hypothetical protein
MNILNEIREKIISGRFEYSRHALDQSILRKLTVKEIKEALLSKVEIIEDYPDDYYGPSCLLLGFSEIGKPIHIVCSYPTREILKLITVYVPDEKEWKNYRTRI